MRHALALGRRGLGRTGANPSVGCVIVASDGRIVGSGRTSDGGRPHGEINALAEAGGAARGATAYVTPQPRALGTQTPSCAQSPNSAGGSPGLSADSATRPRPESPGIPKIATPALTTV